MTKDNSESFKYDGKYLRQGDLIFNLATAALRLNEYQKKIDELEEQLRGERQATKTFSEHLNNERVRHGSTEKKLQAAEEKLTECASNYWKEVEKRKAAEEENKRLQNKIVEKSREVTKMELILENNHLCRRKDKKHIDNIEEQNKILREAVEFYARKENWTRRGSQFRLADYGEDDGHSYRYGYLARQALEKVGGGK